MNQPNTIKIKEIKNIRIKQREKKRKLSIQIESSIFYNVYNPL